MAWGLWKPVSQLTRELGEAGHARLARAGVTSFSADEGLALFDAALSANQPVTVLARLDLRRLRAEPDSPAVLRNLTGGALRQPAQLEPGSLGENLLDVVKGQAAAVLGHESAAQVDEERGFLDMGFDSLTAIELRNRLSTVTGLPLPATTVFDYPTPALLAERLQALAGPSGAPLLAELGKLEGALPGLSEELRSDLAVRLREFLSRLAGDHPAAESVTGVIKSATDDEVFSFIETELGISRAAPQGPAAG
jgi:acyl carrier protein